MEFPNTYGEWPGHQPVLLNSVTFDTIYMGKFRRGGYIFVTWKGDHAPRHVHVYRNRRLVLKWNLEEGLPMIGKATKRLFRLIAELELEGKL